MNTIDASRLLRLQQLGSASLPVGAYAFSLGLESAIEAGWLATAEDVAHWLAAQLEHAVGRVDVPIYFRLTAALRAQDLTALQYWNDYLLACRETLELRLSDTATGQALASLLPALEVPLLALDEPAFLSLFAQAAVHWGLPDTAACATWLWSWLENQVIATTKLLPLGQTRAQQLLSQLQRLIPPLVEAGQGITDAELGGSLPALAISSCHHEIQYSRLFRS